MRAGDSLTLAEAKIVVAALEWFEEQWPFDPESQSYSPPPFFSRLDGEVAVPERLEVKHFDGWRIGWLVTEDSVTTFVRDYAEDPQ